MPAYPKPIKKKKTKVVKDKSKSYYKKQADKLFSIYTRSVGYCEKCGKTTNLQAAHIKTRRNLRLRYDENNVICLCAGCHMWWHHDPIEAVNWFIKVFPSQYLYIQLHWNEPRKMTVEDYKDIIEKYKLGF